MGMKIVDIICKECGAAYQVAESTNAEGPAHEATCTVCGSTLARWDDRKLKAFRLVMPRHHKYSRVPVPPSPLYSIRH